MASERTGRGELPDAVLDDCPEMGPPVFDTPLEKPRIHPYALTRRTFLRRSAHTGLALGAADFLNYLLRFGDPHRGEAFAASVAAKARESADPHYLIYWYVEGGWESYDMFSPLDTANNVLHRLPPDQMSKERYRVLKWGQPGYTISRTGNIRHGYLADPGRDLFPEMAVLSSMHTGSFHSGERLKVHMGSYDLQLQADREPDERSVMQAFAEVYGQPYLLPNLSWHWWLSDGELNEVQYTGRKGYCADLGPAHAHTFYAGTPANLRDFLLRLNADANDAVNQEIERFLDDTKAAIRSDREAETVKAYDTARQVYASLNAAGKRLDRGRLSQLFSDATLKERFKVSPGDELMTYQSVNGNKARTKFSPAANVQAMMTYEMMREGLSCAFFIETRDIRSFDSHYSREALWDKKDGAPRGEPDQTAMMKAQLWEPLLTLVELLKQTPHRVTGRPLWDYTTIVLTSEFGRTIHGDVDEIRKMSIADAEKQKMIDGQDISQHWHVTSAAFLGPKVRGDRQYGGIGANTMMAVPLLPDGTMDPAFDPGTGEPVPGRTPSKDAQIPNHGDVYATALSLADIPKRDQKGRNDRAPLTYIKKA